MNVSTDSVVCQHCYSRSKYFFLPLNIFVNFVIKTENWLTHRRFYKLVRRPQAAAAETTTPSSCRRGNEQTVVVHLVTYVSDKITVLSRVMFPVPTEHSFSCAGIFVLSFLYQLNSSENLLRHCAGQPEHSGSALYCWSTGRAIDPTLVAWLVAKLISLAQVVPGPV